MTTAIIIRITAPDYFRGLKGPWTIKTKFHRTDPPFMPKTYVLCHDQNEQRSIPALDGTNPLAPGLPPSLARMIRECVWLNSINAQPRPAVQCAADAPNPHGYLQSLAGVR